MTDLAFTRGLGPSLDPTEWALVLAGRSFEPITYQDVDAAVGRFHVLQSSPGNGPRGSGGSPGLPAPTVVSERQP